MRHNGTEYGYILSGRLQVSLGFDTYEIGPGDTIAFRLHATTPLRNGRDETVGSCVVRGRPAETRSRSTTGGGA